MAEYRRSVALNSLSDPVLDRTANDALINNTIMLIVLFITSN